MLADVTLNSAKNMANKFPFRILPSMLYIKIWFLYVKISFKMLNTKFEVRYAQQFQRKNFKSLESELKDFSSQKLCQTSEIRCEKMRIEFSWNKSKQTFLYTFLHSCSYPKICFVYWNCNQTKKVIHWLVQISSF